MKKVGILYHPMNKAAYAKAEEIHEFLDSNGVSVWVCSAWEGEKASAQVDGTDLILTIGGDGTILRAVQAALPARTPITGVNLGKLGFMTELSAGEALKKLPALLAGEGWIDERAMVEVKLSPGSEEKEEAQTYCALNDIVVARGTIARIINIEASIDGELLTTYRADGVIVATATGSTGYSLSAGGPVLHPQAGEFLLTPIMSHLGANYCLALPAAAVVRLNINTVHQATLSVDGHINIPLSDGAVVTIKRSTEVTRFFRTHPRTSFYSTLERRLKGKQL